MSDYYSGFDLSGLGDMLNSGADLVNGLAKLIGAVRGVKRELRRQDPAAAGHPVAGYSAGRYSTGGYAGGARPAAPWLGEVQRVAAGNGDGWLPERTAGYLGVDLTGTWCPPMNPLDQCVIRQSGPYLNVMALIGGAPTFVGEGLVDPRAGALAFAGRYGNGAPAGVQARLSPGPVLSGVLTVQTPWGYPMTNPLLLQRA